MKQKRNDHGSMSTQMCTFKHIFVFLTQPTKIQIGILSSSPIDALIAPVSITRSNLPASFVSYK